MPNKQKEKALPAVTKPPRSTSIVLQDCDWASGHAEPACYKEGTIEHAFAFSADGVITVEDLPERISAHSDKQNTLHTAGSHSNWPTAEADVITLEELQRRYIDHVLQIVHGNKQLASKLLGASRRTLYRKIAP